MTESRRRPPIVLMINDQEWSTRSLESILAPNGFAILRAYTGRKGFERARTSRPDIIIIDANLPDYDGLALCRDLRNDADISPATPIVITTAGHTGRQQRLDALRAGAWDFLSHPMDAEEILLRFDVFTQAKLHADRARDEGLLDDLTGLYNVHGLARRARELGSQAFRQQAPLACIVIAPELGNGEDPADDAAVGRATRELAHTLKSLGRVSDAIGRVGQAEFAVFAAGTDEAGVARFAERIAEASRASGHSLRIRAGYEAVGDFREARMEPVDLLERASTALRQLRRDAPDRPDSWLSRFEADLSMS